MVGEFKQAVVIGCDIDIDRPMSPKEGPPWCLFVFMCDRRLYRCQLFGGGRWFTLDLVRNHSWHPCVGTDKALFWGSGWLESLIPSPIHWVTLRLLDPTWADLLQVSPALPASKEGPPRGRGPSAGHPRLAHAMSCRVAQAGCECTRG